MARRQYDHDAYDALPQNTETAIITTTKLRMQDRPPWFSTLRVIRALPEIQDPDRRPQPWIK